MNTVFKTSFIKDAGKISSALRPELDKVIIIIENASSLQDIPNLKKLKGYKIAYRVKINSYRLCINYENDTITLVRFLPRKEVYRFFP
jgi:mRNA interferase RelE/StbE